MPPFLDTSAYADAMQGPNLRDAAMLLLGFAGLVAAPAMLAWGIAGLLAVPVLLATVCALVVRMPPDAMMRLYRATPVPQDDSQLSSLVDVLAYRAALPRRPDLYVVPSLTLNAFAAGSRDHSAIAVTEGLLRRLSLAETAGVLAHEVAHIRNNDLLVMGLADVITRVLQLMSYAALGIALYNGLAFLTGEDPISWWVVLTLYLAPALFSLLQLGLSRTREFQADADAAALTGDAPALASALRRLETTTGHFWEDLMFPVPGRRVPQPSLIRSHPETEDRIARLAALKAASGGQDRHAPLVIVEQPMVSLVGYGPGDMRPRYRWPGLWF
ncbi:protease [Hyphomicrobium nitrativorans NL23]|uniref:Protease n=1 Tax=Hyphomicrobium nitrativorans NL23 TaxID=1029756 RepID=V5SEL8_9HYPH|nr:zinc metalloprotease HtpX [Hyphomicrobium nitrativorans]AHB49301.1 protease [Hyphomicrobium nitrativorans NL23]